MGLQIEKSENGGWIVSVEKQDTFTLDKYIFTKLSDMTAWLHVYYTSKAKPGEWVKVGGDYKGPNNDPF